MSKGKSDKITYKPYEQKQVYLIPYDLYVIDNIGIESIIILQNVKEEIYELQKDKVKKVFNPCRLFGDLFYQ